MTALEAKDWLKAISATITNGACIEQRKEALFIGIKALNLQIPVEPRYKGKFDDEYKELIPCEAECPICGYEFEFGTWNDEENHHCVCGQKIKWSKE